MLAWAQENNPWDPESFVDGLIAAANSIPEGAPVGTIARRPDGAWLAHYYTNLSGTRAWLYWPLSADDDEDFPDDDAADSWPVIYDPDEYHEGDKPRLERLMREPSVFDADPTAQQEPALRERFPEQASAYVADPELAEVDDEPLPSGSLITPKPRTPRVVDRLGVDERGSRWRNCAGLEFWHDGTRWVTPFGDLYGEDYEPDALPPYTEITDGEAHE
ncbi:Uncharacterised protein [Mycobacteroides abscessus subsp. massiliense]|nr:Uncharacterised protein [Mycobacteroides abscessus subsp. massiliense]SLI14379.1 Uncharacterised protein [Mycobacteroides abscessus subsp. massiliense]